jgi:hypothetical protein
MYLDAIIAPPPLTGELLRKAQLMVANRSTGVEDCRELLEMLGLNSSIDKIVE